MSCPRHAAGTIELFFYGELPVEDRRELQEHIRGCARCREALEELSVIRAALALRPDVATPPGGDWSGFMSRLHATVSQEAARVAEAPAAFARRPGVGRRMAPYVAMAALLALVTLGVAAVIKGRPGTVDDQSTRPGGKTAAASDVGVRPDAALVSLSDEHFERSKLVVLGLVTKQAGGEDWAYERGLATTLLNDTRLYKAAAEQRGMQPLAAVMRDLELVLLQASMSAQPDGASLQQLQRLIRRRDLLTKMNVVYTGGS